MGRFQKWWIGRRYDDVRLLIYDEAHRFYRSYGGDLAELISEAHFIFVKNVVIFNQDKAKLTTWIVNKIRTGLLDYHKKGKRHKDYKPLLFIEDFAHDEWMIQHLKSHNSIRRAEFIVQLFDSLDADGQQVVRSVLNPDYKLQCTLRYSNGFWKERRALRKYLIKHHQWEDQRVDDAFQNIQHALRYSWKP